MIRLHVRPDGTAKVIGREALPVAPGRVVDVEAVSRAEAEAVERESRAELPAADLSALPVSERRVALDQRAAVELARSRVRVVREA